MTILKKGYKLIIRDNINDPFLETCKLELIRNDLEDIEKTVSCYGELDLILEEADRKNIPYKDKRTKKGRSIRDA